MGGEGHHCLTEKVAGAEGAHSSDIEVTGGDRRKAVKQIPEQPEADIKDSGVIAATPATDADKSTPIGLDPSDGCEECEDELEDAHAHLCECFEETGKILCESCWEEWLEENEL